jgi:hypothetical protein
MDEQWSIWMKKVKLDENFGDKKMSFWKKKSPKLTFLKKKFAICGDISPLKKHW